MEKNIILWTEELSTGITWQDIQHQEFLSFTNLLFDDFYTNKGILELGASIQRLELYAKEHLQTEERYMYLFEYTESVEHKRQHKFFLEFIADLKTVERNSTLEGARLCNKLNNWFADHIRLTDQALGKFLITNGQK